MNKNIIDSSVGTGGKLLLVFTAIAALFPIIADAIIWFGSGQSERFLDADSHILFQILSAAAPFALGFILLKLGAFGTVLKQKWSVWMAFAVISALWLWVTIEGYTYQTDPNIGGGANIGLGIIMLASPFIAFAIIFIPNFIARFTAKT